MISPLAALKNKDGTLGMTRLITALVLLVLVGATVAGLHYWFVGRFHESTDDAYLQADTAVISPQVGGTVIELKVSDNQLVKKGDVLLRINDRDYRTKVAQSEADVASAQADLDNEEAQIARQEAAIRQAEAQSQFATADAKRYANLVTQGAASEQLVQKSRSESKSSGAALDTAQKQLAVVKAEREKAAASLAHAQAVLEHDRINLEDTVITAPLDGAVADRNVEFGEFVQTGARLLTIVPLQSVYLIANFKETQVRHMLHGSPVSIAIDAFPGVEFKGTIDSLAPGTGAQFALLPPENATGNFTKIVQRVPVKILLDRSNALVSQLRPGLSVSATVDTRGTHP